MNRVSAEAGANFFEDQAGDGVREFGNLSFCMSRDFDGETR